ncbi:MAG: HAD family hydrolase [Bacteroidales bacterium]|nr:HAD family hydrolase [Bacteroidales bacterium]
MITDRYKAVVFDFDGTLYPKTSSIALHLVLSDLRHMRWLFYERVSRKELAGQDFQSEDKFYAAHFAKIAQLVDTSVEAVESWYKNKYRQQMLKVLHKYYHKQERVDLVLQKFNECGIRTGCFSDYGDVHNRLKAIGIESGIDYEWGAEEMGALKPAARPFAEIIKALGVQPSEVLMVGDRIDTDGAVARAVGTDFIYIKKNAQDELPEGCGNNFKAMTWSEFANDVLAIEN